MFDFERLEGYNKALGFCNWVYEVTKQFPYQEQFGIVSQIRRASVSIPSNIAEGVGRFNKRDRRHFYRIARSSAFECIPLLEISLSQQYISKEIYNEAQERCEELAKILSGLIKVLN